MESVTATDGGGRRALIVGAGVGGLAAAIALTRAGWQVQVFERAASPRELGFALLLAPNAMLALRKLGLYDAVLAAGAVAERGEIRRADGRVLRHLDFRHVNERVGAATVCVLRTALYGALLDAVAPGALRLGRRVVDVTVAPGGAAAAAGAAVTLDNGERHEGDVLIGADGVGSVVRRALHPGEPPARPSGILALRGLARGGDDVVPAAGNALYWGWNCEAGTGRAGPELVYWFIGGRVPDPDAPVTGDPRARLQPFLAQMSPSFRAMVAATDAQDLRLDALWEREPLDRWGTGSATLLGDAAHPMLPHAGQGAAQALEDAVALGEALSAPGSAEAGLRAYERTRIPRTTAIVRLARRNARIGVTPSPVLCALRNLAARLVPMSFILKAQVDVAQG